MTTSINHFTFEETYPEKLTQSYQLLECLNQTDGQETLLAVCKKDSKRVIIKKYDSSHPLSAFDSIFGLKRLSHRGIPSVIEEIAAGGEKYLVREYIEGESLVQYARTHAFSEADVLRMGMELCDILAYIHGQENPIIHRDIKPENIIVRDDGSVALIDFGIAREYKDDQDADTVVCGTRQYAAPEQYGCRQTDKRTDLYALSVVLTWMLTGSTKRIEAPKSRLEKVLHKGTAFAPEERWQTAEAFKKSLQNLMPENVVRRRKRCRAATVCTAVILLMFSFLFGHLYLGSRKNAVVFVEPLIEEAARLQLGKADGVLTREDLEQVTQIYIIRDQVFSSEDDFYRGFGDFYAGDQVRGDLSSLEDLKNMPNIKDLYIGAEQIKDVTPLEKLDRIERVELFANDIRDLSALAGKQYLTDVKLADNPIKSIDFLADCPHVTCLILHDTGSGYSGEVLENFTYFHTLDISCDTDCYKYLAGKTVQILKLGGRDLYDLECIRDMAQVRDLYIYKPQIQDISALAGREDIVYVYMGSYTVEDIAPLFEMPNLEQAVVNPGQKAQIDAILQERAEPVGFEIEYLQ